MIERPILFSTPMVRAILEGRKTQTRRTIDWVRAVGPVKEFGESVTCGYNYGMRDSRGRWHEFNKDDLLGFSPYGLVEEMLWVRESWRPTEGGYAYRADHETGMEKRNGSVKWRPSIFMPRAACRLRLCIEDIRVERLQDISEEDAVAEGCSHTGMNCAADEIESARHQYERLWGQINGMDSWGENPWVWVIVFGLERA